MRFLWVLFFLLALAVSPLLALVLAVVIAVSLRPFRGREYGHPSVTLRGEVVRSCSEKAIADWFYRNGIRYQYEYPAFDRKGSVISRPDFYLPDCGVYVEYWGLAGASRDYERTMKWKLDQYGRNGIRVVSLDSGDLGNLDECFGTRP